MCSHVTRTCKRAYSRLSPADWLLQQSAIWNYQKLNRETSACSERGRKSGIPCSKVLPHNAAVVWITLWFLVRFRIIFKILTITFKAIYNMAPKYLSDLITFKTSTMYHLRSNNKFLLSQPSVKTRRGDRAFVVAAPKLWNDLAYDIRITSDFTSFKQKLKTVLFNQAYK